MASFSRSLFSRPDMDLPEGEAVALDEVMGDVPAMAKAICTILSDPERAMAMGIEGRARVLRHFTVSGTARRLESVFLKILKRTDDTRQPDAPRDAMLDAEAAAGSNSNL